MTCARRTDVAVVGAGVVGLAVTEALHDAAVKVACFERGAPGAQQSAGLERLFRHRHDDDEAVRLVAAARREWRRWEARTGRRLLGGEGVLVAGPSLDADAGRLARAGVPHRLLGADEQVGRLGIWREPVESTLLDVEGGAIRARRVIELLAARHAARIVRAEVERLDEDACGVALRTTAGTWVARAVVICAGRDTPPLALSAGLAIPAIERRQARVTFRLRDDAVPPGFLDRRHEHIAYGVPCGTTGRYSVGVVDPSRGADDVDAAVAYVERRMRGLDPEPLDVLECATTQLPWGEDAVAMWRTERVIAVCGNNLFKLAPRLGALLCEAALQGGTPRALAPPAAS